MCSVQNSPEKERSRVASHGKRGCCSEADVELERCVCFVFCAVKALLIDKDVGGMVFVYFCVLYYVKWTHLVWLSEDSCFCETNPSESQAV